MLEELADYLKEEVKTLTFKNSPIITNNTKSDNDDIDIDNKEFIPILNSILSSGINLINDLYLQVFNNSTSSKVVTWIISILITTFFCIHIFNFFNSNDHKKDGKKKKKLLKRYSLTSEYENVDSIEEESKIALQTNILDPKELFIRKAKQFQNKLLTSSELDAFVIELRNPGIMINYFYNGHKKQKIMRLDKSGNFYWSKENPIDVLSSFIPSNKALYRWPATSIQDAYENDSETFILQLKGNKNMYLSVNEPLSSERMIIAFKSLIEKLKEDLYFATNVYVDLSQRGRFTLDSAND